MLDDIRHAPLGLSALLMLFIYTYCIKNTLALAQNVQQVAARCFDAIRVVAVIKQHLFTLFHNFGQLV